MKNIADDISLETPTLPRSKIYCRKNALFCKNGYLIIPYSEIAWVYLYERRMNGIRVDRSGIICTKDNMRFTLPRKADEASAKAKTIRGIILLAIAVSLLSVGLIRQTIKSSGIILLSALAVLGIVLIIKGRKKKQ